MIRSFTHGDVDRLYELYTSLELDRDRLGDTAYKNTIQLRGYVFGADSRKDFEDMLQDADHIFVFEKDDEIKGYILASYTFDRNGDDESLVWVSPNMRESYYSVSKSALIHHLIVDPALHRKKIGTRLLTHAENALKSDAISHAFVTIQIYPLVNTVSIPFHVKLGYQVACMTTSREAYGFSDYMSCVLGKKLL